MYENQKTIELFCGMVLDVETLKNGLVSICVDYYGESTKNVTLDKDAAKELKEYLENFLNEYDNE